MVRYLLQLIGPAACSFAKAKTGNTRRQQLCALDVVGTKTIVARVPAAFYVTFQGAKV